MINLTRFFLFLLITLSHSFILASGALCLSATPASTDLEMSKEIRDFFSDIALWTEVKSDGSLVMTNKPPVVRIRVNFLELMKTQITENKVAKRKLLRICKTDSGFSIISKETTLLLDRTAHGIRSRFRIPIIGKMETYYYMPTSKVE